MAAFIIIMFLLVVFLLFRSNMKNRPVEIPSTKRDYIPYTETKTKVANIDYDELEELEVKGVHIARRKNYILNYCDEYDDVTLFHDKNNKHSDTAVGIRHEGTLIGYLSSTDREDIGFELEMEHRSYITTIDYDGSYLDVHVQIDFVRREIDDVIETPVKTKPVKNNHQTAVADRNEIIKGELLKPDFENVKNKDNILYKKKVVITGKYKAIGRTEIAEKCKLMGADVDGKIGKKTAFLITGDKIGPKKSEDFAKMQSEGSDIRMMNEVAILTLFNSYDFD